MGGGDGRGARREEKRLLANTTYLGGDESEARDRLLAESLHHVHKGSVQALGAVVLRLYLKGVP